jgi:5-methyltetrahydropteroyltriglutamate--homocysteine methyltransferase
MIEHPRLIADRLVRYANIVGRENVISGTDCGPARSLTVSPTTLSVRLWVSRVRDESAGVRGKRQNEPG